jgi:anaerobic ribonucleoside-triphosphate reductase activating protein
VLKYLYCKEIFREIPSEITLGVSLSGCTIKCPDCNQKELWEDKGTILDVNQLDILLRAHQGISCILLMGAEHNIDALTELFMYAHKRVKTAWYCGLKEIPKNKRGILQYLDYVKVGPFIKELGGLDSPTTNQRLYKIEHQGNGEYWETDITYLLQNNKLNKETKNDN